MGIIGILLAFFAGVLGSILGGTPVFICTGFVGLIWSIMTLLGFQGMPVEIVDSILLNLIFVPCISFNGAVIATAYASRHHNIRGVNTERSLLFTKDIRVFLCGGITGIIGYLLLQGFTKLNIPMDIGALVVVLVSVIGRILFNQEQWINKKGFVPSQRAMMNLLVFQVILSLIIALLSCLFVDLTKITAFGFYISAALLIFSLIYPQFPATHHISMIAAYMFVQTGNICLSVIFGILSQLLFTIFGIYFNVDCGTHIDPPAFAIATLSLIIFTLF